ncbi:MAG: multidrug effflux MFS transporter [Rhodoferax sp.]
MAAERPRVRVPLWPLALITLSGTSAMHMFVPALPVAAQDLGSSAALVQLTISVYIFALGLGQLVVGPLSDSFGRRPLLLGGLLLFTAAGLAAAFAPNVHLLIVARFAQALGGCVGVLLPRAIVRDTDGAERAVRRLALMGLMTMIGPGLSPLLGGALAQTLGWRAVFAVLAGLGTLNLLLAWRLLPETGSPVGHISLASVRRDYRVLLGTSRFVAMAIGGACSSTATYAYITAAPFLFVQQLHRPPTDVGLYLGLMIVGAVVGNALAGRLAGRVPAERLMIGAHRLSALCALAFFLSTLLQGPQVGTIVALMFLHAMGAGMCGPVVSVQVLGIVPGLIGSASGLYGFVQMLIGALSAALVTLHPDAGLSASVVMLAFGILGQACFLHARRGGSAARP